MPSLKDVKPFVGLLFHGTIHCLCQGADTITGGMLKNSGITPLLQSFGQSIADSLGAEHFKEIFNFTRIENLLKTKKIGDLNHDLEHLFMQSAIKSIGYIKMMLQAEIKEEISRALGVDRKELRSKLGIIIS